jgi:hypothetical protein
MEWNAVFAGYGVECNVFMRVLKKIRKFLELLDMAKFDRFLPDNMNNLVIVFDIFVCQNVE